MSECPAFPGSPRCPASICDCFIDLYPDDPTGLHPEAFIVGDYAPDPTPDLADGRAVSDMADNEDRDHDEGRL